MELRRVKRIILVEVREPEREREMEGRMKKYRGQVSPERAIVWREKSPKYQQNRRVSVVYYLCRNRQLEHPHFMEVPLSSLDGLYLRGISDTKKRQRFDSLIELKLFSYQIFRVFSFLDVIDRLDVLRGRGMASMYSWSCKR